jgi:hypothetical protein
MNLAGGARYNVRTNSLELHPSHTLQSVGGVHPGLVGLNVGVGMHPSAAAAHHPMYSNPAGLGKFSLPSYGKNRKGGIRKPYFHTKLA